MLYRLYLDCGDNMFFQFGSFKVDIDVEAEFYSPVLQMEIMANVPWVLNKKIEYPMRESVDL